MPWTRFSQAGETGIFLSAEDFLNDRIKPAGGATQLQLHDFFKKDYLEVRTRDTTYVYQKKELYGYTDKQGNSYRIYNSTIYPILNPRESILLYRTSAGTGLKNSPLTENYFFSAAAGTSIQPLTLKNLEDAFPANKTFTTSLELYFKNDDELAEYDKNHHMYKLNRLLELSNKSQF